MFPSYLLSFVAPFLLLLLLLLFLPLSLLLPLCRLSGQRKNKLPPGPKGLPIIGNLHQLGTLPHQSLAKMSAEHGPLMSLRLGSVPTLVVSSAAALRSIFPAHDIPFSGRPALYAAKKLIYAPSDVGFAPLGDYWREVRKICVLKLLSAKRVESFRTVREEEVASMVASIVDLVSSFQVPGPDQRYGKLPQNVHQTVDVSLLMLSLANKVTCRIAFGRKYDRDWSGLSKILVETQNLFAGFCVADFFPWLGWVPAITGLRTRMKKNSKELDRIFDEVIEEHLRDPRWLVAEHEDFVHVLLKLHKDTTHGDGVTFNNIKHIKGIIMDVFLGGTDTTSTTLVWAMTELMRNPVAMNKLRREVGEAVAANDGKLEETALQHLGYLKQVIKEVLRVHPPVPLLVPRETTESCRVGEYEIPAGTRVLINAKAIAMNPECWENPEEFRPERFSGEEIDYTGPGFETVPFGIGRRICPGVRSAMALAELALASLVYNFEWELPDGMEPDDLDLDELPGITVNKKIPLRLVAKPIINE